MISIVYCTIEPNPIHVQHLKKSVGIPDAEVIEYVNKGEGLTKFYNKGLEESKYDIVVFCHDDILLNTTKWGKKIISHFDNSSFGILGVAGTTEIPETGKWWENMKMMLGQVKHTHEGKYWNSIYCPNFGQRILPAVIVDGLFFAVHKKKIKCGFSKEFKGFHFYEIDFCVANFLKDVKIGVLSNIRVTHKSIGQTNEEWENNRLQFIKKFGEELPIQVKGEMVVNKEKEKLKTSPLVGVVIPTKGNVKLLLQCLQSFIDHDDYPHLYIYIADTGSYVEEKDEIKKYLDNYPHPTKFIEYDYYNFAKINNDVVKNHVGISIEFLLFCNNDIKLVNNAITKMVKVIQTKKNVGTVGARLYFENDTIQHGGIMVFLQPTQDPQNPTIGLTHKGFGTYYGYSPITTTVLGNTGAFLLIKKSIFEKVGPFNESYIECYEDVELNIKCLSARLKNYFVGEAVCYHYESQTRNDDSSKNQRQGEDHYKRLIPTIIRHQKSYEYFENASVQQLTSLFQLNPKTTQTI